MTDIEQATEAFVKTIKNTDIYKKYAYEKQKMDKFPDLKNGIDEYRKRMYVIQNTEDGEKLFDDIDRLEQEGAALRDNPLVNDFLAAELSFCRMMQEIYTTLTAEVDFDIELSGGRNG